LPKRGSEPCLEGKKSLGEGMRTPGNVRPLMREKVAQHFLKGGPRTAERKRDWVLRRFQELGVIWVKGGLQAFSRNGKTDRTNLKY